MKEKKHKHKWEFVSTYSEYPVGYSGTTVLALYALLLCQCTVVKKVKVIEE